jgi:hypothetical protein
MIGKLIDLPSLHSKSNGCIGLESSKQIRQIRRKPIQSVAEAQLKQLW